CPCRGNAVARLQQAVSHGAAQACVDLAVVRFAGVAVEADQGGGRQGNHGPVEMSFLGSPDYAIGSLG
ncbi:hypothetical protein ACP3WA_25610, partial [Salmonella enterica]|uniref:hypothetical protein n=1 Tax=Salmonella enterica TaxID=28901 RepID=UPI003CF91236